MSINSKLIGGRIFRILNSGNESCNHENAGWYDQTTNYDDYYSFRCPTCGAKWIEIVKDDSYNSDYGLDA